MDQEQQRQQQSLPVSLPEAFLECGICLGLVCEPVSVSCGHTFCRTCLVKTLRRSAKRCPSCRAACHTRAEDQPQNVMIAQIAKAFFPDLLERRMRETEAEKAKFELCLPAFFYNVSMFPGETLWLHFFEPRYKLMMKRIIDTSRRFAYVPNFRNHATKIGDTALVAEVCEAEFLSDGRVMVKSKLMDRYHIQDDFVEDGTQGLHYCQLEPYGDVPLEGSDAAELEKLHAEARALCNGFLGPFKAQLVQTHGDMPQNAVDFSMWMASFLPFYLAEKHALLESTCTRRRLSSCIRCVASMQAVSRGVTREEGASEANISQPPPQPPSELADAATATAAAAAGAAAAAVATASPGIGGAIGAAGPGPVAETGLSVSAWGEGT